MGQALLSERGMFYYQAWDLTRDTWRLALADTSFGPKGWTPEALGSLLGKTYVITGASSGTGFEAARILLEKGARVIMLNRNPAKSEEIARELRQRVGESSDVQWIQMDLSDLSSVRRAAAELLACAPRIDALLCNAAVAQVPKQVFTTDGFESHLGTNHYGHFALQAALFERIEDSQGRIVVMSSLGYKMGLKTIQFDDMNWDRNYHQNKTYCHSKLAQMMAAYELQDRIKAAGKQTKVYVCHPGASRTSLIETNANAVSRVMFSVMALLPIVQSAERGAYPMILCATQEGLEERAFYGPTGFMETTGPVGRGALQPYAVEKPVMARLWSVSEAAIGEAWSV